MSTPVSLLHRLISPCRSSSMQRRPVRVRFTVLYGVLFLLSGAILLAIANSLAAATDTTAVPSDIGQSASSHLLQNLVRALEARAAQAGAAGSHQFLAGSAIAMGVMVVISVVLGWIAAGRVLRPLRIMTATVRQISENSLHERLAVDGPADEMKELGDTIDGLLERLEGAFAAQRRFVANASHELRTPLATMRASLDVAVAKPGHVPGKVLVLAGRLRTELDQVERLLEHFLLLASAQHGVLPGRSRIRLAELVAASLAVRAEAINAGQLTVLSADHEGGGLVDGSPMLLRSMVDNLLDNAIKHNERGGWIRVVTESGAAAGRLVVETGGQVLDQRKVRQLAQPFRRLGADRTGPGSGLGLSIVDAIAAAHRGTVDLQARAEGGLRVTVELPLAQDRAFLAYTGPAASGPHAEPSERLHS
jgi:signal transduction histidine kinase